MNNLKVSLGTVPYLTNTSYSLAQLKGPLRLQQALEEGHYYTLLFLDLDNNYLQALFVNLSRDNPEGEASASLQTPTFHGAYLVALYEQPAKTKAQPVYYREEFPLKGFVFAHVLKQIASLGFSIQPTSLNTCEANHRQPEPWSKYSRFCSNCGPSLENEYSKESPYFRSNAELTEREKKTCRCYIHVAEKNDCEKTEWGKKGCYNPYAVCNANLPAVRSCSPYYDFEDFTDRELKGYVRAHAITVKDYTREEMLTAIKKKYPL